MILNRKKAPPTEAKDKETLKLINQRLDSVEGRLAFLELSLKVIRREE